MAESRRKGIRLVIILCVVVALAVTGILIWTSRRATVRFYSEQGALDSISVSIGGTIEQPKDPKPKDKGYAFAGWYSDPGYTTEFDFDLPIERDTTIYVKWVERTFTVTVVRVTNSGSFNEVLWSSSGKYKSVITLPTKDTSTTYQDKLTPKYNFQRANQTFVGFATRPNDAGDFGYQYLPGADFTIPNDSVFLYAIFRGEEHSFTFNPNTAEGEAKNETGYFNEYFTAPQPDGLSKQYHSFAYWCTDPDGVPRNLIGQEVDLGSGDCVNVIYPGDPIKVSNTTPHTLYAIWRRNQVNIMIDAQGGDPSLGIFNDNLVDAGLEGGYDLSLITEPVKDGYRLMGYNTLQSGLGTNYAVDAIIPVEEENISLYAVWARLLTVGYSLNNTQKSDDELFKAGDYGDFVGVEGETFTILGLPVTIEIQNFTFLGWSLDESANSAEFHQNDVFTLREADFVDTDRLVLYGVWRGDSRTLKLKNTSDNQVQEISSYYGRREKLTSSANHEDSNYYFVGWGTLDNYDYKNPGNYTGTIYGLGEYFEMGTNAEPAQANDILYSLWCPYSYDVTYFLQGGELKTVAPGESSYTKSYVYKETITLYSSATREGYRFMGWSYSVNSPECAFYDNGEGTGYTLEMPGNSFQLYAVWAQEYSIVFYNNAADATGLVAPIEGVIIGEEFTIPSSTVSNDSIIRANYSIIGWGTQEDGGTIYNFGDVIELEQSDQNKFYAVWKGYTRNVEIYDANRLVTTIEGEYGTDIPLVFEEEIENADEGYEIGGFYAILEQRVDGVVSEKRYELAYGGNVKTTGMYFQDKDNNPVETLKLYIIWNRRYFNIAYELNGGIYNNDDNDDMSKYRIYAQYKDKVTLAPLAPTKNRYEFKGWVEDVDNPTPVYAAGGEYEIPARNVTLYALWARIYTLSYSSNGGELAAGQEDLGSQSYAKGTRVPVPNSPYTKTYYTFSTWNTRADGNGTNYSIGSDLEITADVTLYAIWLGQEVSLTLIASDPDDSSYNYQITVSPNPRYGDTVSINTWATSISAPAGLQLKGWKLTQPSELNVDVDYTNDYVVDQVGNIQLFSVWAPKSYYFIIGLNGGIYNKTYNDHSTPTPFRTKVSLSTFTTGSAPIAKEGYRLLGFADNAEATVATYGVDAEITMPAESKKIYCVWQELTVITFDKNCTDESMSNYVFNGVFGDATLGAANLAEINKGFKRTNYTLLGWSTSSTAVVADAGFDSGVTSYVVQDTNDIYLYAVWEGRAIKVTFDNNPEGGGNSSTTDLDKKYGDVIDLTDSSFQRTNSNPGFAFGGWSTTKGEGNNGGIVGNIYTVSTPTETTERVILYAIWNKKYFTLTYDYGDSSLGSKTTPDGFDSRSVQYTSTVDVTEFVTYAKRRLGYDFMGWAENVGEIDSSKIYGRPNGSGGITNTTLIMPNANITLHAIWEPIYVSVVYKSDTPTGATEQWLGVGTNKSYTTQQLYQLSFTLPTNTIQTGIGVYVSSYRFVGWKVKGDTSGLIRAAGESFQVNVRDYIELLAQWEENIISVVVNANGGIITAKDSSTATYSVREKHNFTLLKGDQITRSGHRLVSYTINNQIYDIASVTEVQITTALMSPEDMNTNTVRMTANWVKQVTVSFNKNGKYGETITGTIEDRVFDAGTSTILPACNGSEGFQRTYYQFIGWNEYSDGTGTTFLAGNPYTPSFDTVLYAVWEGNERTVKLHYSTNQPGTNTAEGGPEKTITGLKYGSLLDTSLYSGTADDSAKYKLEGWTQIPYQIGWGEDEYVATYLQSSKIEVTGTDADPVVNLYAVWVARDFKVTYNANGGIFYSDGVSTTKAGATTQADDNFAVSSGTSGEFYVKNPSMDRNFYTFVGWSTNSSMSWENASTKFPTSYTDISSSAIYTSNATNNVFGFVMPAMDVTLYAVWEPVLITVQYYLEPTDTTAYKTEAVRYNKTVNLLEGVTKQDNNFGEWRHVDTDKTTEVARFKAGTSLKIYNTTMTENEQKASNKIMMFIAEWIPQTVYVQIIGNGGQFTDGTDSRLIETSVGRKFQVPAISDATNQLVYVNFALKSFNLKENGSSTHNFSPGSEITIPSLSDSRLTNETITLDNGEEVTTYLYKLYAQWVAAEAFINRSTNDLLNPYYETLAGAIADANNGETVKILKDCYIKSEISINKQIIIEPATLTDSINYKINRYINTVDGTGTYTGVLFNIGTDGILTVGEDTADLLPYSITFDGKASSSATGSIFNVSGILRLYNGVVVRNNYAVNGGAINMANTNASAIIHYTVFEENQASTNGGAIYVNLASNVEIKFAKFEQNYAEVAGGAIYNNKIIQIQECEFSQNESEEKGGAIYNTETGSITDSTNLYDQNEAKTSGGAIYNAGTYTLSAGTFTSNEARTSGGAIFNAETSSATITMTITDCVFGNIDDDNVGNNATASGGALQNQGKLSISGSSFYHNVVAEGNSGGAVFNTGSSSALIMGTTTFEGNSAPNGYGGAVYNNNGTLSIGEEGVTNSTIMFKRNSATTGRGYALAVAGGTVNVFFAEFTEHVWEEATSYGGVVFQSSGTLNFYGGTIHGNTITKGIGGGILISGGTCNVNNLLVYNNTAKSGGGIAMVSNGTLVINTGEIYQNTAGQGGGIYMRDKNTTLNLYGGIIGSTNADNKNLAQGYSDDAETIFANGGGIYSNGKINVNGGIIRNNEADANGGGIYSNGTVTLVSGSIIGNIAAYNGGAIYADATGGSTNGTVTFNTSTNVKFLIQDNLCADGAYKLGVYDDSNGEYYANGIYTSTKTIISGYMEITSNGKSGDDEIYNDIFIAVRDNQDNPTRIVEFNQDTSKALNDETKICISSKLAEMGDKLVKFPSRDRANANLGRFLYAGDESGFRVKDTYLVLGNYTAIIMRGGAEVFYQTLVEAYIGAQEGEEIILYKNINMQNDLQAYNDVDGMSDAQEALIGSSYSFTDSFYVGKKVTIVAGAEYTISRGGISGDLFTVVGQGQLTLGKDTPITNSNLIIRGDEVETGSLIKVEAHADDAADVPKLIINHGVTLTGNHAVNGSAIFAEACIRLIGGTITGNVATENGGAVYATKFVEITKNPTITANEANMGGGIYIVNADTTTYAMTITSETANITENEGKFAGGGIYVQSGKIKITACNISENVAADRNKAGAGGGGIYMAPGSILETAAKVKNDATNAGYIKIVDNESGTNGGGVVVDNATFTFPIGTITGNDAASNGGGVAVINTTGGDAAGVFTTANASASNTASYYNNLINSNSASNGGGIAVIAGTLNISYTKIYGNTATRGGAIYNRGEVKFGKYTFIGNDATSSGNTAELDGGGVYNDTTGVITQVDGNTSDGQNLNLLFNQAMTGSGGGIANNGTMTFSYHTKIYNNRAAAGAGVANLEDGTFTINGVGEIYANATTGDAYGGGGLYNSGTTRILTNYSFGKKNSGNESIRGGGIYNGGTLIFGSPTELKNITISISYNRADLFGGGLYMINGEFTDYSTGNTTISENTQSSNAGGGGGMCIAGGAVTTKFYNYYELNADGSRKTNCWLLISKNSSGGAGGGILVTGTAEAGVTLNSAQITNNTATGRGGGFALQGGDVRFGNPTAGQTFQVQMKDNSSNIGAGMYLATVLYVNCNQTTSNLGTGAWGDEIYLANARSYMIYAKSGTSSSYAPEVTLYVKANDYTDGRRIAKFGTYLGQMEVLNDDGTTGYIEYETTFAEDYFSKFGKKESGIISGITYDDNGYVVFADPVAYNIEKDSYHANLAEAALAATSGNHIYITKSHTVTNQVLIVNKSLSFVIAEPIILTRSPKLFVDVFRIFTTTTSKTNNSYAAPAYTVTFNEEVSLTSNDFGTKQYGKNVRLTIDGNKDHPTLFNNSKAKWGNAYSYEPFKIRGSLIGANSGAYTIEADGTINPKQDSAGFLCGHAVYTASDNVYLNGSKITTATADNWNIYPVRANLVVMNTDFKNNFAACTGSAITFKGSTSTSTSYGSSSLTISSCNFENNETGYYSWQNGGNTTPTNGSVRGGWYTFYQSGAGGGAVFALGGTLDISYSNFDNNISGSHGGALSAILQQSGTTAPVNISNCSFTNNVSKSGCGGAAEIFAVTGDVNVDNTTFSGNQAHQEGGALYLARTSKTYQALISEGYVYTNGHELLSGGTWKQRSYSGTYINEKQTGGSWETYDTTSSRYKFIIGSGCTFEANASGVGATNKYNGGAIMCRHYLYIADDAVVKIDGNTTNANGGGIWAQCIPYIDSTSLEVVNNTAASNGGGIYFERVPAKVNGLIVSGNVATNGGGMYFATAVNLDSAEVTNNEATTNGGGRYFNNYPNSMMGGRIDGNSAANNGGGIYCEKSSSSNNTVLLYNMISLNDNKASYKGGAIYCYGSCVIIGDPEVGTSISNNVIDKVFTPSSSYSPGGGGAGIWSYWEVRISGKVNFLNNKITAPGKLTNGGGAAIFLYSDELWLSSIFTRSGSTYTIPYVFKNYPNTYLYCFYDSADGGNSSYQGEFDTYYTTVAKDGMTFTLWRNSSYYTQMLSYANVTISGNSAGQSEGDGIYYWGANIYMSGVVRIEDEIFMNNSTSSEVIVDNYLAPQQTPFYFTYPNAPADGASFVNSPYRVTFQAEQAAMFNVTNDGYYTEKSSGTYGAYNNRTSTSSKVYIKMYKGTLGITMTADIDGGERYMGTDDGITQGLAQFNVGFGDSLITIYKKVRPYKEGHIFKGFEILNASGGVAFTKEFTASSVGTFPTKAEILSAFSNVMPSNVTMRCLWEESAYTIYVHKYIIDTGSITGGKSTYDGEYAPEAAGGYSYTITSNQSFATIFSDLETTASTVDSTKKKNYLAGYTPSGYMLSYDMKYYKSTDKYPYTFGYASSGTSTDIYIVYTLATYTLTFNKDANSTFNTENTTMQVKYGQYTALLTANMISRPGYRLSGWLGSDGKTYKVPGDRSIDEDPPYTLANDSTKPWLIAGNKFTSNNAKTNDRSSQRKLTLTATERTYISFKYKASSERNYDFLWVDYYPAGSATSSRVVSVSGNTGWYTYTRQLNLGDRLVFTYKKDGSVDSNDDKVYIKDVACNSEQTVFKFESDLSFTPVWAAQAYDVRVYYNYPDGGTSFKLYSLTTGSIINESLATNPIPEPTGYTLGGYSKTADGSSGLLETEAIMPGEELILYAQWTPIKVVVSYYDEDFVQILHQEEYDYGIEIEVWKTESVAIWYNVGNQALYDPGSAFLIASTVQLQLSFRAYTVEVDDD